ncbi:MAG TPA: glycosyltransferase [Solirubrobacteraceae bacterium]|nr:glycosyltransferase [Solirubrobacteraceae bacterium]
MTGEACAPSYEALSACLGEQAPIALRLLDLEELNASLTLPMSRSGIPYRRMLALVRRDGRPLGWRALPVSADGSVALGGLSDPGSRSSNGRPVGLAGESSPVSVVVTTCAHTESVLECVQSIVACAAREPDAVREVIVVENRPVLSTVERALEECFGGDPRIRYVEQHRRGLSHARNAGLDAARGELVAFTDDDIKVDRDWLKSVRATFAGSSEADCVTGLILPLELENPVQTLAERFASFGKGLESRLYSLASAPPDQPLFPYSAGYFGSGANMVFRAEALRGLGGFDPALGAGTRARGGEDLDVCIRLLNGGGTLAYEPAAIVWHRHPDAPERLREQVFAYGVGLGALLGKQLATGPNRRSMLARAPQGLRYFIDPSSRKNVTRGSAFPVALSRLERAGVLCGPAAYLASRAARR